MRTPEELREGSRQYLAAATAEPEPHLKLALSNHALALRQLAETMERKGTPMLALGEATG